MTLRNIILTLCLLVCITISHKATAQEPVDKGEAIFDPSTGDFTFSLELGEVVIDGDIFKGYSPWKSNPALDIVKELISNRDSYRADRNGCIHRDRNDRMSIALSDATQGALKKVLALRPDIFLKYVDTYPATEPVLHLTCRESSSTEYFESPPNGQSLITHVKYRTGIDDFLTEDEIDGLQDKLFCETDLFAPAIELLDERFTSPLSPFGIIAYRFAITDTVIVNGTPCIDLLFAPVNPRSNSFTGHIWVDTTNHIIRRVQMSTPPEMQLNFVKNITIIQTYEEKDNHSLKMHELAYMRFGFGKAGSAVVHKETDFDDYTFPSATDSITTPVKSVDRAKQIPSQSFSLNRQMMNELRTHTPYRIAENIAMMAYNNYLPSSLDEPKIWWGPITTLVSINNIEGIRFRLGGKTSAFLNPHIGGKFYIAYGTRDQRFKYMGELEYSFIKKKYQFDEFPIHSIRLHADNDIYPIWQRKPDNGWDNLFESWRHFYHYPYALQQRQELSYNWEFRNGFSGQFMLRHHSFTNPNDGFSDIRLIPETGLNQSEMELSLRYAPGEQLRMSVEGRYSLRKERPIFTISHTIANKGIAGSDYNYQHTEFSYRQRWRLGAYGYIDNNVKAGRVWTPNVPVPLLIVPNVSTSYSIHNGVLEDSSMKLVSDRYISWNATSKLKGVIFNHIPLIRNWGWHEIIGMRTIWLPESVLEHGSDGTLFDMTSGNTSSTLAPKPSIRLVLGVDNIFRIMEIDYYRRITYRDMLSTGSDGIQLKLKIRL